MVCSQLPVPWCTCLAVAQQCCCCLFLLERSHAVVAWCTKPQKPLQDNQTCVLKSQGAQYILTCLQQTQPATSLTMNFSTEVLSLNSLRPLTCSGSSPSVSPVQSLLSVLGHGKSAA
jgi:hypothetical protein